MNAQPVTVYLPSPLYQRLQKRAHTMQHSVEEEINQVLVNHLNEESDVSSLEATLVQLDLLSDNDLLAAAQSTLTLEQTEQMQAILNKQQNEGLTEAEWETARAFSELFNRTILIRAKALALLQERGHTIDPLLQPHHP